MRDPRWTNVSAGGAANAGTAAMGMANSIFNKALSTAQDGLTKHQEEMEKNNEANKAANTALVLKMKSEGKPVSKDFLKELGVYDGKEINEGAADLRKEEEQNLKNAAQIANWQSGINRDNAYIKENALENQLKKYGAKLALDKQFGVGKSSKSSSSKKGKSGGKGGLDPYKFEKYLSEQNIDERSKTQMRSVANDLANRGADNDYIMRVLQNEKSNNWLFPNALGGDSYEFHPTSDPAWGEKHAKKIQAERGL